MRVHEPCYYIWQNRQQSYISHHHRSREDSKEKPRQEFRVQHAIVFENISKRASFSSRSSVVWDIGQTSCIEKVECFFERLAI